MNPSSDWLENRLTEYAQGDAYPFHMPGHKRNPVLPGHRDNALFAHDITEIDGFDDLHDPSDILKREMERAAAFYGTEETVFSVNGSTGALLAAVSAAVPEGGKILAARNCHRSIFHAAFLRKLHVVCVMPGIRGAEWACAGGPVSAADVEALLQKEEQEDPAGTDQRTAAVVITSPTYDGIVSDVRAIAEAAHRHGAVLIVDEAHGAHLRTDPYFPDSAVSCGADLVVQSMHKTLPAMTQTALLHNVTGRVPQERLRFFMDIYESSSPSYVLMESMTACLHFLETDGGNAFRQYAGRLARLRERLGRLKSLQLLSFEEGSYDPSKLCIGVGNTGLRGPELYDLLRDRYHLQMEMKTPFYVLAMTSVSDTEEGFRRLAEALEEIDGEYPGKNEESGKIYSPCEALYSTEQPKIRMTIAEAAENHLFGETSPEMLRPGETCTFFVDCYPPDIPLLLPGEIVPEDMPERIRALQACGLTVRGLSYS
ncbi:MAG: aminotransferase class I/II-fold pyridoxal phosphate-dependent enzyme [Lachnospiraceae bacterium]|nr:aminotransferase class I/II-fold pyridoxal phosphate-dependent enzyme [Lachnospiraceae bacterium]